jgi:hypothetical protein
MGPKSKGPTGSELLYHGRWWTIIDQKSNLMHNQFPTRVWVLEILSLPDTWQCLCVDVMNQKLSHPR